MDMIDGLSNCDHRSNHIICEVKVGRKLMNQGLDAVSYLVIVRVHGLKKYTKLIMVLEINVGCVPTG